MTYIFYIGIPLINCVLLTILAFKLRYQTKYILFVVLGIVVLFVMYLYMMYYSLKYDGLI